MTCHSSSVPTTPTSASQVARPTRQNRRHASRKRRLDSRLISPPERLRRYSTASATIEAITHATPSTITPSLSGVGEVMKRVSMSMRADSPACAATFRSVNTPATWGFFSGETTPGGAGNPDEVGADLARVGPDVQRAARPGLHGRPRCHGCDGVADSHDDDIGGGAHEQAVTAGVDACRRNRRHHETARVGQRGDGQAGDRDVEGLRRTGHQRCGDVGDQPVRAGRLRPQDGGGGLFDRQQRNQPAQQQPRNTGDDGDEACELWGPLLLIAWHDGRS